MKKVNCILLVDDSPSTNFFNKKLIQVADIANEVYEALNGIEALDFLLKQGKFSEEHSSKKFPRPNIIFLDINMPLMDGFEFLEHYSKIKKKVRADMIVVFLTTSNWCKDRIKALDNTLIFDYIEKPLELSKLKTIAKHYINNFEVLH
ncbi:response regulator [Aquimarina sp. TRL1]|uniref:response regulator n=1 Tax=Aquimarina sp. (strain TRL1) TaxID=2736252 RepID=UPI00158D42CE|nr:response regulator [Aquimarina sp. TRL1]QKX04801.1 response regulator [Aquimarina sp. TRL1]